MMKSALVWIGIIVLVLLALKQIPQNSKVNEISFSTFYTEGTEGRYRSVTLTGQDVEGTYKSAIKGSKGEQIDHFTEDMRASGNGHLDIALNGTERDIVAAGTFRHTDAAALISQGAALPYGANRLQAEVAGAGICGLPECDRGGAVGSDHADRI